MYARREGDEAQKQQGELSEQTKEEQADERVGEIESGLAAQTKEFNTIHKQLTKTKEEYTSYEKGNIKKLETKIATETKKIKDATNALEDPRSRASLSNSITS